MSTSKTRRDSALPWILGALVVGGLSTSAASSAIMGAMGGEVPTMEPTQVEAAWWAFAQILRWAAAFFVIAAVIFFLTSRRIERRSWPRIIASIVALLVSTLLVGGIAWIVALVLAGPPPHGIF